MMILGIRIDELTLDAFRARVRDFLRSGYAHTIFTPNPEMLVDAQHDTYFRDVLNKGDLNICDGKGIELVSRGRLKRLPGIDAMVEISAIAAEEGKSIYLLGSGSDAVVAKTKSVLMKQFPSLMIAGIHPGMRIKSAVLSEAGKSREAIIYEKEDNDRLVDAIIDVAPDILFVAFGHSKQEKWLHENLPHLPSVRVAMGVGGAFDMIAGRVPRAPRLLRQLGVEWLWRLLIQPWRIRRIWKATVTFLYSIYRYGKNTFRA